MAEGRSDLIKKFRQIPAIPREIVEAQPSKAFLNKLSADNTSFINLEINAISDHRERESFTLLYGEWKTT